MAVENEGRHNLLEPDAWPIARLTGMRGLGPRENMRLEIPADSTHLPHLAGAAFQGDGVRWHRQRLPPVTRRPKSSLKMVVNRVLIGTVSAVVGLSLQVRGSPSVVRGSPDPAPGGTDRSPESRRPAVVGSSEVRRPRRTRRRFRRGRRPAPSAEVRPASSDVTPVPPGKTRCSCSLKDGFEHWSPLSPERQRDAMVQNVVLTADHLAPEGWATGIIWYDDVELKTSDQSCPWRPIRWE